MKSLNPLFRSLTALAVIATVSPVSIAQNGPAHGGPFGMLQHDQNQDGQVTLEEFTSSLHTHFSQQDADGNGVITSQERQAARAERREAAQSARFAALDEDGNGVISETEFATQPEKAAAPKERVRRFRAGPGGGEPRGADRPDMTYTEFSARPLEHFKAIDANADSVVTQTELHTAAQARRNNRQ